MNFLEDNPNKNMESNQNQANLMLIMIDNQPIMKKEALLRLTREINDNTYSQNGDNLGERVVSSISSFWDCSLLIGKMISLEQPLLPGSKYISNTIRP